LLLDHSLGKGEFHFAIEHPSLVVRALACIITLEGGNFIAEEFGLLRARMSNARFGLGEFQLEVLSQERSNLAFYCLSFFPCSDET